MTSTSNPAETTGLVIRTPRRYDLRLAYLLAGAPAAP